MRKERMNESEVMEALRVQGVDDAKEVKLAMVENDGRSSTGRAWRPPRANATGSSSRNLVFSCNGVADLAPVQG